MELKWGQTPWDDLSKEELLREVQRMYCALSGAYGILQGDQQNSPNSLFYGYDGRGGRALEMARQALSRLENYDSEDVYRSFFRYAYDLLFVENPNAEIGFGWLVCPKCGVMIGNKTKDQLGVRCSTTGLRQDCDGVLRLLEWSDLAVSG